MNEHKKAEEDLTFEDIRIHFFTGQAILVSGEGRNKTYRYRNGVATNVGDIQADEWGHIVRQLIVRYGEQELFHQLVDWIKKHCPWARNTSESERIALDYHVSRMPDNPLTGHRAIHMCCL